ncbi:MAG: YceH family protein [Acidobacteriaceae bacterium]
MDESQISFVLSQAEIRVLGSLIEKDATTPDYYPLSLNALVNACNQKSNRDPVLNLDENAVRNALETLHEKRLAGPASGAESRVTKYEHWVYETLKLSRPEVAILCELLLRGPQTPGELRGRAERLHRFENIEDVLSTLRRLMDRTPPLAAVLPRQPGTKEARYAHLLAGEVPGAITEPAASAQSAVVDADRLSTVERRVEELSAEVERLKRTVTELQNKAE